MPEQETSFIDALPEEVKTQFSAEDIADPNLTKYKTLPDFIKGHKSAVSMIAAKGVILPKDETDTEGWDKVFNTLGRPDKPEGYKFTEIKGLHPEITVTPESLKAFTDFAHKNGFTNKQVDVLNQWYMGNVNQMLLARDKAFNEDKEKGTIALKNEWKGDYDKNLAVAKTLVEKAGGKELIDAFGDLGNKPAVLKFLANLGSKFSEDTIKNIGLTPKGTGKAQEQIDAIKSDKKHPYWNQQDPNHDEAVLAVAKLYEKAEVEAQQ